MVTLIRTVQMLFGLAMALGVSGWCLWRLGILFGLFKRKTAKNEGSKERQKSKGTGQRAPQQAQLKEKKATISKQALYSAQQINQRAK